jgi:hypothetical protein
MRSVKTAAADAGIRRRSSFVRRRRRDRRGLGILNGFLCGAGGPLFLNGYLGLRRFFGRGLGRYLLKLYRYAAGCCGVTRTGWPGGDGISWIWRSLAMRDEFIVAGSTGPRRNIWRHAAGPTRPIIGNGAGESAARSEHRTENEQDCYRDVPLDDHLRHWIVEYAASLRRAALTIVFDRAHSFDHFHGLDIQGLDRATAVQ